MTHNHYIYILIMAGVSYAIRVLPLTLIRRQITSRYLRSFLYYVPYVTLAVMTFPAIVQATQSPLAGVCALVLISFAASWCAASLPLFDGLSSGTKTILLTVVISGAAAALFPIADPEPDAR